MALIKKGNNYYVRYTVPTKQRKLLGRSQVWQTTKTADKAEAKRRQPRILADIMDSVEAQISGQPQVDAGAEARTAAKEILSQVAAGTMEFDDGCELMTTILEDIENASPETPLSDLRNAYKIVSSGGNFMLLTDAIEDYRKTREGNINNSTLRRVENVLTAFANWQGQGDVASVTRRLCGSYIAEVIVPADTTYKTKVWHVSALRSAWRYFISREWTGDSDSNPWNGHLENYRPSTKGTANNGDRRIWSADEIEKLHEIDTDDVLYQIGVLCLHHGTRLEEIAALKVTDIDLTERSFKITDAKNQASIRTMPIHSACLPLFTELVGGRTAEEPLFSSLKATSTDSKFSHNLSKRAGRWLRTNVSKDKSLVFFHSMRHTFTTALDVAGVEPHLIKRLDGHTFQDETFGRYSKGPGLERLSEALERLDFGF